MSIKIIFCYIPGKEAIKTGGVSGFNKAASTEYTSLMSEEKEKLIIRSQESACTSMLSQADIIAAGGKIFKRMQTQVSSACQALVVVQMSQLCVVICHHADNTKCIIPCFTHSQYVAL